METGEMLEGSPTAPAIAQWLLTSETGTTANPHEVMAAFERVRLRLRTGLTVFLGPTGFDSLWARALYLAQRTSSWGASVGVDLPIQDLRAALDGRDAIEVHAILVASLTSFIALLFTFVGEDLGSRLIHQVWPELPPDATDISTGDITA
jgi:hypothetical protein